MSVSVLCDTACVLGEGPSYDSHTDTLWWFDISDRKLLEWRFADAKPIVHELPFMASVLARIDDNQQLIAADDGLYQAMDRGLARATGLPFAPPGPRVAHGGLTVRRWQAGPLG